MMGSVSEHRSLGTYTVGLVVILVTLANALAMTDKDMGDYLKKYGYMSSNESKDDMYEKLKMFQEFAAINVTGEMDEETEKMMKMPRCGMGDMTGMGMHMRRRKRYTLQGSKWPKRTLTYKITKYSGKLSRAEVDNAIDRAFKVWSDVSKLTFRRTLGRADIVIFFASGSHGHGDPFDGPGKVLAHAFFPDHGGDAHFDESETWTVGVNRGSNLFQVAVHEFGHSLGLAHSRVKGSIMAPFYESYEPQFKLHKDDMTAIRILYGSRYKPPDGICSNSRIDAATRTKNGLTFVFKGSYYYRLNDKGIDSGYPQPISRHWKGVSGPIDAALTDRFGYTYLFKGSQFWTFENLVPLSGYPRPISSGFRGIPDDLDAAFRWSGNGDIYFIKGSLYYRYYQGSGVAPFYPKLLKGWKGLPGRIDAALQWKNSRTYMFYESNYYRYNDLFNQVDLFYPKKTSVLWFGCSESGSSGLDTNDATQHEWQFNSDQYDEPLPNSTVLPPEKNSPVLPPETNTKTSSGQPLGAGHVELGICFLAALLKNIFA